MKDKRFTPGSVIVPRLVKFPRESLFLWLIEPRIPVLASDDPLAETFIRGMLTQEPVNFVYVGGTQPGAPRTVIVSLVFQHAQHDRVYVAGYCPGRGENRIFALDLAMVIRA